MENGGSICFWIIINKVLYSEIYFYSSGGRYSYIDIWM